MNIEIKRLKYFGICVCVMFCALLVVACGADKGTKIDISKSTEEELEDTKDTNQADAVEDTTVEPEESESFSKEADSENSDAKEAPGSITVYVCGAVNQPGVYTLSGMARMQEAVEAAGGMTQEADQNILNLAQFLTDGQMIRIPLKGEEVQEESFISSEDSLKEETGDKINLNSASSQELQTIPGIGQSKAEAIIHYREENGRFERIEDIMQISGIKEASFQKMEPYICVK